MESAAWENWKDPATGEWIRTFAVITTPANELVAEIHERMPLILAPGDYARWLTEEPDPCSARVSHAAPPTPSLPIGQMAVMVVSTTTGTTLGTAL